MRKQGWFLLVVFLAVQCAESKHLTHRSVVRERTFGTVAKALSTSKTSTSNIEFKMWNKFQII